MARWDQTDWDIALTSLRTAMSRAAFAAAWEEGRRMTLDQGIELVSQEVED
jgi:hypothetical protein